MGHSCRPRRAQFAAIRAPRDACCDVAAGRQGCALALLRCPARLRPVARRRHRSPSPPGRRRSKRRGAPRPRRSPRRLRPTRSSGPSASSRARGCFSRIFNPPRGWFAQIGGVGEGNGFTLGGGYRQPTPAGVLTLRGLGLDPPVAPVRGWSSHAPSCPARRRVRHGARSSAVTRRRSGSTARAPIRSSTTRAASGCRPRWWT